MTLQLHQLPNSCFTLLIGLLAAVSAGAQTNAPAPSKTAPQPRIVTPGKAGDPPSDAIVLFDGHDLSAWRGSKTNVAGWKVENGWLEVVPGAGNILTKQDFGDIQLHVEWASPSEVTGKGQGRGNSGVYFMGRYEIQVLDSFENETYPDGQAAAYYRHAPPLVNACRKPGEWQTYDIIFHAPKRQSDGRTEPGSFTVFHNGVLAQDHIPVPGDSTRAAPRKTSTADKAPLYLQNHRNAVRYRNIWVREL